MATAAEIAATNAATAAAFSATAATLAAAATTANPNICISDKPLGIQHPYSYCVKPSEEMVPGSIQPDGNNMNNTRNVLTGIFSYIDYLTLNATPGTADVCKDAGGKGIIGNKYFLRTNIKCRAIDEAGATISGDHYLHKYIDNASTIGGLLTGGRPQNDVNGLIPSTFASAGKIGGNVMDIMTAFSGDTNPYCMKVKMKCHVINSENEATNYKGFSPDAYLSLDDIRDIKDESLFEPRKPIIPDIPETTTEEFTTNTPDANINNIINNIIYQNTDKIQSVTELEKAINQINFQDEFLIKTYYVGFSILLIIIIFKLINKKY
uniref:Uncharacterized protein n=1 Tax=viral metagenome TaxID=1070528 RepID=A0A6C0KNT6_9ZZZZ